MEFIERTIAPAGRNKYGNYVAAGNTYKSVVKTTYAGNNTTTTIATPDVSVTPTEEMSFYTQALQTSLTFDGSNLTGSSVETKSTSFQAFNGIKFLNTYIGDIANATGDTSTGLVTLPSDYGIKYVNEYGAETSVPNGLSVSVSNNGTSASTLFITANSNLSIDEGTLKVPIVVYAGRGGQPEGDDLPAWYGAFGDSKEIWLEVSWGVDRTAQVSSVYRLSLSNDNTSIICDSEGNFVTGSTLPSTQAKVYYGSELQTAATYSISANTDVTGMSTGVTGGVMSITFDNSLQFSGGNLAITISGKVQETVVDVKTFNISKAYGGKDGTDATIYWMMLNTDSVIYNPTSGIITPNIAIKVSGYTQTGANPAQYHGASNITVDFISRRTGTGAGEETYAAAYPDGFTPSSGTFLMYNKLRFRYYADNAHTQLKDMEDVDLLMDGTDGIDGSAGRAGAAIRGPYDWADISGDTRYYYAGEESIYEGSEKWIDVILKDGVYYYCTQSVYFDSSYEDWSSYLVDYFQSGETMNFVAANLLLADNAKIKFQTGNEIYMENSAGTVTAGVYGGNGSDVAFWAGNNEADPKFSVDHDGNLIAKQGKFFGNVYIPYTRMSTLRQGSYTYVSAGTVYTLNYYDPSTNGQIISDVYNSSRVIMLPEPTEDLYGFTYRFVAGSGQYHGQYDEGDNYSRTILFGFTIVPYNYGNIGTKMAKQIIDLTYNVGIGS